MPRSSAPSLLRRAVALAAVPALSVTTLAALPAAPAVAAEPDPAPAAAGATWLAGELEDGLMHNPNFGGFDDYGLTIDAGLALIALGGHQPTVDRISNALAERIDSYTTGTDFDAPDDVYAGAVAKAASLASAAGDDPRSYGGRDLVALLEGRVATEGAILGRIQDRGASDFANVIGQSFAAQALDAAGSDRTSSVTEFLLLQQCADGFFRQDFAAKDAAGQGCDDDPAAVPSIDVTAQAVLSLQSQADDDTVSAALTKATEWLADRQTPAGGFGSSAEIATPNANSTGLAGRALASQGRTGPAERAAVYVRALQVDEPAPCATPLAADTGAIAYDGQARGAGRRDGITVATEDQFRRATAQALPLLAIAPTAGSGAVRAIDTDGYFRAGSRVTLGADGLAPGDTVCFSLRRAGVALATVGHNGQATTAVRLPDGTARRTYLSNDGTSEGQPMTFAVLDRARLSVSLKRDRVRAGRTQVVRMRGLEPGERYRVKYRGKVRKRGVVSDTGRRNVRFSVGRKDGRFKVLVIGQFGDRRGADRFRVVR